MVDKDPLNRRYSVAPELAGIAAAKARELCPVQTTLLTWCAVHGALQLAMRHPGMGFTTRAMLEPFVDQLSTVLVQQGFLTPETIREAYDREAAFERRQLEGHKPCDPETE